MTPEREKIVVDVDGGHAEEMSPDLGERHFQLAVNEPRRVAIASGGRCCASIPGAGRLARDD